MKITDSIFSNNQADYGGALYNDRKTTTNIANSTFGFNTAKGNFTKYGEGGAIVNYFGKITIKQSLFVLNTATRGGAIMNHGGGMMKDEFLKIENTLLANNKAEKHGGAIFFFYGMEFCYWFKFYRQSGPRGCCNICLYIYKYYWQYIH